MAKQEKAAEAKQAEQSTAPANKNRFNESMIDWQKLENFGISREYLKDKGMLDGMLKGYKSSQTVPISMNFGAAVLRTDARLSFQQSQKGPVVLAIHGIRQEPQLQRPFCNRQNHQNNFRPNVSLKIYTKNNPFPTTI